MATRVRKPQSFSQYYRKKHPEEKDSSPSYCGHDAIMEWIGRVVLSYEGGDYQGSTYAILEKQGKYAYLCFGYGTCSGCDALKACDTWEEVDELANDRANLQWMSKDDLATWLLTHDWDGDFASTEKKAFAFDALRKLQEPNP